MDTRIDGLVAVITGSGGGIGRGIALKLAERGAMTVINDIAEEKIKETIEAVEKEGRKATGFTADVSNKAQVDTLFKTVFEKYGRVDILVNNAGIADDAMIEDMSESQWDRVMDVNLKGAFLCSQAALKYMRKNKYGRIINVSAEDIFYGEVGMVNYHCSKYGMLGLTIAVANEMARFVREERADMTCNCITPGYLETSIRSESPMKELRLKTKTHIPLGRECDPKEDAGNTALFLASKEAGYITSNIINAGGGLFMSLIC
jgi:3-oxoacyl-[acyl-carrier protein] reductase